MMRLRVAYNALLPATSSPQWMSHHQLRNLTGRSRGSKPQQEQIQPTDVSSPACLPDSLQAALTYTTPSSSTGSCGNVSILKGSWF
ncbi:hypothetical protein SK128_010731, partial [Halocaridina rubra]